jgi:methylase of polypeptide subunit release factors
MLPGAVGPTMARQLTLQGIDIFLEDYAGVWMPSPNGLFYAHQLAVEPGERVIDIGTGSGILAIWAAKRGAQVVATDTDVRAIEAARRNAEINGVHLELLCGPLFAGAQGRFDAVFANLPNEIVAPALLETLPLVEQRVFAGGERGNEVLLDLLESAPDHLRHGARIYLPVHSLTDYRGTLATASRLYEMRLIGQAELPAKPFVLEAREFYRRLEDDGVIELVERDGRIWTIGSVYELRLKADVEGERT